MQGSLERKYNYLEINMLEDKNGKKYSKCKESENEYKIFNPETDPFKNSKQYFDVQVL